MKKYVGLGGRGGREKPPAPASPLGASSNPLGKPGTWGEGAQGASGTPPISFGTWQPPPFLAAAVLGQDGSAAPPQHPAPPCSTPAPCAAPAPSPLPTLLQPWVPKQYFWPPPSAIYGQVGGDCTPLYPPFPCPAPCKARRRMQGPGALRPQTTARHSRQGRAKRK